MNSAQWARVTALFDEARERSPLDREAWLRARCDDDETRVEVMEMLRAYDDDPAFNAAVEEALRFESSNQLGNRIVTKETQISGILMPKGTLVTIGIGAANRDGDAFPDPDRFDIARNPTRHLAFGSGIHMCAGMSLARLEGRVAIERFLKRFPRYTADGAPVRSRRARFRGFVAFPIRLS